VLKDTFMSLGLGTGNSSLKFKQSTFVVQLHLRRESLEWQSLDSQRQSIDLRFKDMKNMLFSNKNSTISVSLTHCKLY
ncbi:hypothetical protein KUCAC02_004733, partial [Chaenocephalus aceratus]